MNLPLINDALAMFRLQFQPLEHYQYRTQHTALALLLLGIVAAASAPTGMGEPLNVIIFFTCYITLETLLYGRFMQWWLRRAGIVDTPPLTGVIIAASGIQLLDPLSSWFPADVANIVSMAIGMIGLWLLVSAIAAGTGVTKLRVLLGTFLFAPMALLMSFMMMSSATSIGLINMPDEIKQAMEQAKQDSKPQQNLQQPNRQHGSLNQSPAN